MELAQGCPVDARINSSAREGSYSFLHVRWRSLPPTEQAAFRLLFVFVQLAEQRYKHALTNHTGSNTGGKKPDLLGGVGGIIELGQLPGYFE